MTTIDTSPPAAAAVSAESTSSDSTPTAITAVGAWVTSSDHKRIGRLWIGGGLLGTVAAAVLGAVIGVERIYSGVGTALVPSADVPQYVQSFRFVMILAAVVPLLLGLALAVVPLQLGARAVAFPRLALGGFWAWATGVVLLVVALFSGGRIGGADVDMVGLHLLAHGLIAMGVLAAATSIATSVLTTRAPGMTMRRVPMFAWSALVSSLGVILALPVMIGAIIYLFIDVRYGIGTFGGSDGIGNWIGWAFGQPLTFLFALPALGVFAELVPVTFRKRQVLRGVVYTGLGLVGIAAFAGITQQSIFAVSFSIDGVTADAATIVSDLVPFAIFNLLPVLGVVIVLAMAALTAKPTKGGANSPKITAAFVFSFFGLGMVLVGMLGNAIYAIDDLGLAGTVFEEGALVYVVYGGVLGALGGIAHWAPKLWGRKMSEKKVIPLALTGVLGTILASLPLYVAGFSDQPAGQVMISLSSTESALNTAVLAGHVVMLLTVLAFVGLALATFTGDGEAAGDDPWEGHTIEWSTSSPAPGNNFPEVAMITSAEPMLDLKAATDGSPS
jgi:heme/copper-type cytochrome/quinol oxidase subunit 1